MIKGVKVILRPLGKADFPLLQKWLNDPQTIAFWYGRDKPRSMEWVKKHYLPSIEGKVIWRYWVIEVDGKTIGYICNTPEENDDHEFSGRIELDILIGVKNEWGKGYGTDALRAMVNYAFNEQGAERVYIVPSTINPRAIHVYEKVGFKMEGILRHYEKFEGKWINGVMMAILKDEFKK